MKHKNTLKSDIARELKVTAYGGGVQSTALLVLAAQGELDITTFLFANVGDDSEHPATLQYVREVAMPYAHAHGIYISELHYTGKNGEQETLYEHVTKSTQTLEIIPVYLQSGQPGIRACTSTWKIGVIAKWLRAHGATAKAPATVALGISLDEYQRMKDSASPISINRWPLIERRLSRKDCVGIIQRAGLPVPRKSACFFCPFTRIKRWHEMADKEPELFARAAKMETIINDHRHARGKDDAFLTRKLVPLERVIGTERQGNLWQEAEPTCDSGYCFM